MLVVLGGMGPRAGIELHQRILQNTVTDGTDQAHLDVLHVAMPSRVHDRTAFLADERARPT